MVMTEHSASVDGGTTTAGDLHDLYLLVEKWKCALTTEHSTCHVVIGEDASRLNIEGEILNASAIDTILKHEEYSNTLVANHMDGPEENAVVSIELDSLIHVALKTHR